MKTTLIFLFTAFLMGTFLADASTVVRVKASNYDISDNLDLEAVASIFGDSENLTDFERRLNNAGDEISNLDLNEDGYVDYLRVVEYSENDDRYITIQAVLGDDLFQDVATIELEREGGDQYSMIIVGNHFIYGNDYIIRPVYVHRPTIFSFFFGPFYQPWHSPYYWGYYPTYYTYRSPYHIRKYREHIHRHIDYHHHYEYLTHNNHQHSHDFYSKYGRNDYGSKHPEKSFENRNDGVKSRHELDQSRRRSGQPNPARYSAPEKSVQPRTTENRRGESMEKSTKGISAPSNRPANSDVNRRTSTRERSVNESAPSKSQNIDRKEVRKSDEKPAVREKSVPTEVKRRSEASPKQEAPKMTKTPQQRSSNDSGNQQRRSEGSAKKQAPEKKIEKAAAPEKKSTENKSRR